MKYSEFEDKYWNNPLPINEAYPCIQGEGGKMGVASLMIRFSGCRLRCQFANSVCDTWYSSWRPEKGKFSLENLTDLYRKHRNIKHTIITGGGPTLAGEKLKHLVNVIKTKWHHHVTIETEGSEFVQTNADLISLSPKLSNSKPKLGSVINDSVGVVQPSHVAQHEKWRKNYDAMRALIQNHSDFQLKFVVSDTGSISELNEIDDIISTLLSKLTTQPYNNKIWLMPEGETPEKLNINRRVLMEYCIGRGYNYSDRLHVIAYGDARGV